VLVPALGPVCFKYPLKAALDDGVLAPVRLVNLYVPLGSADEATYATLNTRIARVLTDLRSDHAELQGAFTDEVELAIDRLAATDGRARSLQRLLRERRVLLSDTPMRRRALQDVLSCGVLVGRMTIVFHERASDAEATLASVRALGIPAVADRSTDDPSVRRRAFDRFRSGNAQVLVAVRTADEGIDVPTADLAVIVNGTSTARQRIQRIGRILRPSAGEGLCVSLLARKTIEETVVGLRDCELVGSERVFHHRWPEVPVAAALMANRSTHEVDRG
jgi:superfamily II DNA or RNA helicase